jgi:hypothetical protein
MPVIALAAPASSVVTAGISFGLSGLTDEERDGALAFGVALAAAWRDALPEGTVLPGQPSTTLSDSVLSVTASALPAADRPLVSGLHAALHSPRSWVSPSAQRQGRLDLRLPASTKRPDLMAEAEAAAGAEDPGALRARLLVPERVVTVLIGPAATVQLLASLDDSLRLRLPRPSGAALPSPRPWPTSPSVTELDAPLLGERAPKGLFSWLLFYAPGLRQASARDRAALRTLAAWLGAEVVDDAGQRVLSWQLPLVHTDDAAAVEQARFARLSALAQGAEEAAVREAAAAALGDRLRELGPPDALARSLGLEALSGRACSLHDELAAYVGLGAGDISTLAQQLSDGPRRVVRGIPAPLERP